MQDHFIPCCGQVSGATHVTVPASVVDWLRRAAYAEGLRRLAQKPSVLPDA
jgi:hypothetical protein